MSNFQKYASLFIVVCVMILVTALCCKVSRKRGYSSGYSDALASIKPDTEYVDKPVYIDKPVPVEVKPAGQEFYPVGTVAQLKKVIDSLAAVRPDTAFVEIPVPMETRHYRDEKDSTYEAQVTGYRATLDWVKVRQRTAYIDIPIPTPVYPELLISPAASVYFDPGGLMLGGGVAADSWVNRWQFSVETGYGIHISPQGSAPGWYGRLRVGLNLIRK
ncbi:MAG: hypothetical protein K6E37_10615 [Bacteroidales bacterium]|nr:hypothetical protein [Bacteroidales bacterium]